MFKMSRDTTINKGVNDSSAVNALKEHLIRTRNGSDSQFITIQTGVSDDWHVLGLGEGPFVAVKPFVNPIKIDDGDDTYIIIDVRSATRFDRLANKPVISNTSLFRREIVRVILESIWVGDGANDILGLGHFQIHVFSTWIAEMFARRFALNAEQQVQISVIVAFYYLCLFTTADDVDLRRIVPIVSRATNVGVTFVMETLRDLEYIGDMIELLDAIKKVLATDRLDGVEIDILINMLAGSWYGPNHAILVGIAIEYPPMWNALLYLSLTDRSTRATGIAKVALRRERDPSAREYVSIVSRRLIQNTTLDLGDK